MARMHETKFWLQLQPEFYGSNDNPQLKLIKAVGLTQKRPKSVTDAVVVQMTVRVPDAAFLPLRPEAIVVIPEAMVFTGPIEVEATHPDHP